jgi:hypothetical protein
MGLQIVFSRTIFRDYHHIKNTHSLRLKHKFITLKSGFQRQRRKVSLSEDEQPSNWRGNPTIDTSQCIALVVMNNILKFHRDRTINDPSIPEENGWKHYFSPRSLFLRAPSFSKLNFPLCLTLEKLQAIFSNFFFLSFWMQCVTCSWPTETEAAAAALFLLAQGLVPHVGGTTQQY